MSIDLRPYGLNWTLDINNPHEYMPPDPKSSIAPVSVSDKVATFTLFDGTQTSFTMLDELGHGSFGAAYKVAEQIDGIDVVVKSMVVGNDLIKIRDAVMEFLIQLVCAEETKDDEFDGLHGPFVPRVYYMGIGQGTIYLVSEKMDMTLQRAFRGAAEPAPIPPNKSLYFLRDMIVQIAKILDILERKDRYSHRDLKSDNIMIKLDGNRPCIKLIDFGFSCLDYRGIHLNSDPSELFRRCDVPSRDMSSLFYNLLGYEYLNEYSTKTCPIKRIMLALLGSFPDDWLDQYEYYNSKSVNPNMTPDVIYKIFKHMDITSEETCSAIGPNWVKHIKEPKPQLLSMMTSEEKDIYNPIQLAKATNNSLNQLCEAAKNEFDPEKISKMLAANDTEQTLNGQCGKGGSLLHVAAAAMNPEFVRQLLQRPYVKTMVFDKYDVSNHTPLHKVALSSNDVYNEATKRRYMSVAKLLLDRNPALARTKTHEGLTANKLTDKTDLKKLIKSYYTKWWQTKSKNTNLAGGTRRKSRYTRKQTKPR
jgi:serine/threonine protein kinase